MRLHSDGDLYSREAEHNGYVVGLSLHVELQKWVSMKVIIVYILNLSHFKFSEPISKYFLSST